MAKQRANSEANSELTRSLKRNDIIDNLGILNRDFLGGNHPNSVLTKEGVTILLVKGSIADQTTDAIVNSIGGNFDLKQGALSKVILEKAGPKIQEELKSLRRSTLSYGEVTTTRGFNLSAKFVFHGVLKKWNKGTDDAEDVLRGFVESCLTEASKRRLKSIAFPAIGTGLLGFPSEDVIEYLINEADKFSANDPDTSVNEIRLVVYENDQKTFDAFKEKFDEIKPSNNYYQQNSQDTFFNDLDDESSEEEEDEEEEEDQLNMPVLLEELSRAADRLKISFQESGSEFPKKWKPIPSGKQYGTTLLTSNDDEFKMVSKRVMEAKGSGLIKNIVQIERIENRILYQLYTVFKDGMERANGKGVENERMLWHGTGEKSVVNICSGGFNRSYCGKNGVFFGQGVYFARDFQYSAQTRYSEPDANGIKRVFLCKVLTGLFHVGKQDTVEPDMRPGTGYRYDSTVDDLKEPTIFVVYKDPQAYPEYLVSFK